jgi:Tfp pilus assembly protein PilP
VALAVVFGALLLAPWWLSAWGTWADAQERAQTLVLTQADLLSAQQRHAQLTQEVAQRQAETSLLVSHLSTDLPKRSQALTQLAERESLVLSLVDWSMAVPVPALKAVSLQHVPMHVQLQGAWPAWMRWWTQLPEVAPLATLSNLDLQAQPKGGWRAQVVLQMPQRSPEPKVSGSSDWQLAGLDSQALAEVGHADPLDARAWQQTQGVHAQQHPSYARWVAPELRRTRSPLEALPRERLRYVGQISQDGVQQALLRLSDANSAVANASIYRVAVGDYLGQDFGRVQTIAADKLTLRELARDPQGVWQPRDVALQLEDGAK